MARTTVDGPRWAMRDSGSGTPDRSDTHTGSGTHTGGVLRTPWVLARPSSRCVCALVGAGARADVGEDPLVARPHEDDRARDAAAHDRQELLQLELVAFALLPDHEGAVCSLNG
eukprot:7388033-Prymnesium_polylepis.2